MSRSGTGFRDDGTHPFRRIPGSREVEPVRRFFARQGATDAPLEETDFPLLDIFETSGTLMIEAELPGVDPDNLQVSLSSGTLVIEGVKEEILGPGRVNFLCMERTFGAFRRLVPLLQPIDAGRITARYRMGILQITIPKLEERRGTHLVIPVTSG